MDTFEPELPKEDAAPEQAVPPEQEQTAPPTQEQTPPPAQPRPPVAQPWSVPYGWGYQQYPPQSYAPPQPYQMPPSPPAPPTPSKPKKKPEKRRGVVFPLISGILIAGLIVSNVIMGVSLSGMKKDIKAIRQNSEENLAAMGEKIDNIKGAEGNSSSGTENTSPDGLTPGQVYAQNVDSVVAINCSVATAYGQAVSAGSGFIWSADGYIVSNYHVVDGADSITVTTHDGTEYAATLIGGDSSNDIALLKAEAQNLRPVSIGHSENLIVGDRVAAVGNALGELTSTLTVGYVSAIDRIVTTEGTQINMIQTDAAINSGNSGGPLFNMKGEVVGITTAKYSGLSNSGASIEGIGFAIPMDDVIGMLEDLRDYGYVTGGYLGLEVSNMDETDAKLYGLPMGALVYKVTPGSCAAKGGIMAQDILVELGGYDIENVNDLTRALRKFDGGDSVTAVVYRGGSEVVLTLILDSKPTAKPAPSSDMPSNGTSDEWFEYFFDE